jgi:predicted flap endonuclease-1-like 5' DNA nuclease
MADVGLACLNCGNLTAIVTTTGLVCQKCDYAWSFEDEQRQVNRIRHTLHREPVTVAPDGAPEPIIEQPVTLAGSGTIGPADDLQSINLIGPSTERKLHEMGIRTFEDLAAASVTAVAKKLGGFSTEQQVRSWVEQAVLKSGGH